MLARSILENQRIDPCSWLSTLTPDVVDFYLVDRYLNFGTVLRSLTSNPIIRELSNIKLLSRSVDIGYDFDHDHLVVVVLDNLANWSCWVYSTKDYQLINNWLLNLSSKGSAYPIVNLSQGIISIKLWHGRFPSSYYHHVDGTAVKPHNRHQSRIASFGVHPLTLNGKTYDSKTLALGRTMSKILWINFEFDPLIKIGPEIDDPFCETRGLFFDFIDWSMIRFDSELSTIEILKFTTDEQPPARFNSIALTEWKLHYLLVDSSQQLVVIASPVTNPEKLSLLIY